MTMMTTGVSWSSAALTLLVAAEQLTLKKATNPDVLSLKLTDFLSRGAGANV